MNQTDGLITACISMMNIPAAMHQDDSVSAEPAAVLQSCAGIKVQFASRTAVTTAVAAAAAAVAADDDVRGIKTYLVTVPAEPVGPLPRKGPPRQLIAGHMVASLALAHGCCWCSWPAGRIKPCQPTFMTCVWTKKA
jgi:hypothetical protein